MNYAVKVKGETGQQLFNTEEEAKFYCRSIVDSGRRPVVYELTGLAELVELLTPPECEEVNIYLI